ncbi:type VI secretion system tip protein VgrG [Paraburkholderia bonniea]|uniref:type VI secretion system Vgr family protein n=1 Tax=Paraburkholderia bonniea TaxID=2152891 RepID=UPI002572AFE0|nr:type VI secretion system Vgr family protein [Paraburkholderia bonniea]WJF92075.1 type VI secretion system tip protein VgrG [Paraburkholderia bonniea]WJF95395.1 type VI secretion system tip protein VgrG [Paraburkholderia bonniea]
MERWQQSRDVPLASVRTGQQRYFMEVKGPANTRNGTGLSIVSFDAIERIGDPYRIDINVTHPDALTVSDYLGRDAIFSITPQDGSSPRVFSGCITRFSALSSSADIHTYRIVVEAHIARLRLTRTSRIYQHQSAPQIIEAILRRHGFKGHQFQFRLRRKYPQHLFRFQYQTADWAYIHLLMEQEGIYCYILPGEFGDVVVFGDDIDHYVYQPRLEVPYRETAGLEAGIEAVHALQTHTQTVPSSFRVADYNPDNAWERFSAEASVTRDDSTTYGQPYIYGTHHLDEPGAKWQAQLRHEAAVAWQVLYEGAGNVLDLRPGRVMWLRDETPEAPFDVYGNKPEPVRPAPPGQLIIEVTHSGARDRAYRNTWRAIPSNRRFRLQIRDDVWPKISGTLSGRVTSPNEYKYAHLTQQGRYVVRFDCDFDAWNPGGESVPLRLAKPFAGALQTGMHFPVIDGTEAVLAFRDGDPNKPYIAQFHHNSIQGDLVSSQERWFSRNVIRTRSDNKIQLEDWKDEEHVKLSTEHSGKSQLTLGHIVSGKRVEGRCEKRGEGFELRTDAHGAIRAGKGLFISADAQVRAQGPQLDMQEAHSLLQQALQQSEALAKAAQAAQAIAADYGKQKALFDDTLTALKQAGILASAPAGIALTSGQHLQLSAAENLIATAGSSADISVVKRFTVAAGEAVSLFAHRLGMKLFAAKGKVEIQAQSDEMRLMAEQNMTITSTRGRVIIEAKEELLLKCGGSYLRMSSTGIEDGTRGDRAIKSASFEKQGPASLAQHLNSLPKTAFNDPYVIRNKITGEALQHQSYEIVRQDGTRIKGITDDMGRTSVQKSHDIENIVIRILKNQRDAL